MDSDTPTDADIHSVLFHYLARLIHGDDLDRQDDRYLRQRAMNKPNLSKRRAIATISSLMLSPPTLSKEIARNSWLVINASPGTSADFYGRSFAEYLSKTTDIQMAVDNKPGAGGLIAANHYLNLPKNQTNILIANSGLITNLPLTSDKPLAFNTQRDLNPIAILVGVPFFLITSSKSNLKNIDDISRIEMLPYAVSSLGSAGHIIGELLGEELKIKTLPVPYANNGQAMMDIIAGRVPVGIFSWLGFSALFESNALNVLMNFSLSRSKFAPNVRSAAELGLGKLHIEGWQGIFSTKFLETKIKGTIETALRDWTKLSTYDSILKKAGYVDFFKSQTDSVSHIKDEMLKNKSLLTRLKII